MTSQQVIIAISRISLAWVSSMCFRLEGQQNKN